MSELLISAALEKRLGAMVNPLATAFENTTFTPQPNVPYQRVHHLPMAPIDEEMSRSVYQMRGIFQVTLCFMLGNGRGEYQSRIDAVRNQFKPPLTLTEGSARVNIIKTPRASPGYPDGDRYCVPISIEWHAYLNR